MIEIARAKAGAKHIGNLTFIRETIDELSVPDRTLDVVLGLSILHFLGNKEEVIRRVVAKKALQERSTRTTCIWVRLCLYKTITSYIVQRTYEERRRVSCGLQI